MRLYIKIWTIEGIFKLSGLFNQYKYSKRFTQTSKYVRVLCPQLSNRWNHIRERFINLSNVFTGCLFMARLWVAGGQPTVFGSDTPVTAPREGGWGCRAAAEGPRTAGAGFWGPRPLSCRETSTKPRGPWGPQSSSSNYINTLASPPCGNEKPACWMKAAMRKAKLQHEHLRSTMMHVVIFCIHQTDCVFGLIWASLVA